MDKFMAKYVNEVLLEFKKRLKNPGKYCLIRELDFSLASSPNYRKLTLQYLYILRYFCAYMCEYHDAYRKIFMKNFLHGKLNVFSVGCGCGVDYFALHFAARDHGLQHDMFSYSGIDIVPWKFLNRIENDDARFLINDFLEWLSLDRADYNVLFFPKSIGEFSRDQFATILSILHNTRFDQPRIVLVNSLRKERAKSDSLRTQELVDILKRSHRYMMSNDEDVRVEFGDGAIRSEFCGLFDYPSHVSSCLEKLINNRDCGGRNNRLCSVECERQINKKPMLRCGNLMYDIVYMSRQ